MVLIYSWHIVLSIPSQYTKKWLRLFRILRRITSFNRRQKARFSSSHGRRVLPLTFLLCLYTILRRATNTPIFKFDSRLIKKSSRHDKLIIFELLTLCSSGSRTLIRSTRSRWEKYETTNSKSTEIKRRKRHLPSFKIWELFCHHFSQINSKSIDDSLS